MNAQHLDALVRAINAGASRRGMAAGLLGALVAPLATWPLGADAAKKGKKGKKKKSGRCKASQKKCGKACCTGAQTCIAGKKCLGACQFVEVVTDTESRQLLAADCATTETIVVENGFILDGNGNTIHMAGPLAGYQAVTVDQIAVRAGLLVENGRGSVKNLKIDQDALQCEAGLTQSAIVLANSLGDIDEVEIALTRDNRNCYRSGISAQVSANNNAINIRNVTINGNRFSGIAVSGPAVGTQTVSGQITGCVISGPGFGMVLNDSRHTVTGNTVTAGIGITINSAPSNVNVDDNTFTGPDGQTNFFGINFDGDAIGSATNNTVSNFNCGIAIQPGPGNPAQSGNDLSGNTTPVCNFCQNDGHCEDRSTSCQDGLCEAVCPSAECPSGCPLCVTHLQTNDNRPPLCANQLTQVAPDTCSTDADCTGNEDHVCIRPGSGPCTQSPCGICVLPNVCA